MRSIWAGTIRSILGKANDPIHEAEVTIETSDGGG
jgi:hypothetical protein